ncbi:MAG: aminotransferase class V-fold PLP-dependent enzyme, partial [Pseudomonadota bacterium]
MLENIQPIPKGIFGKEGFDQWCLDASRTHLNHGAYGALTKSLFDYVNQLRFEIEKSPAYFIRTKLPQYLRHNAHLLGHYIGAKGEDLVFVDNASAGANAVLRALSLLPNDEIVTTNRTYDSVRQILHFVADRANAKIVEIPLDPWHQNPSEILKSFLQTINAHTRLVVVDHITSSSAQILPINELSYECQQRGINILIDGAQAPGILPLDITSIGCHWYIGNLHKWFGAPRGTAFLWVNPEYQALTRPCVITRTLHQGFLQSFDWPGSKDFAAWLSIEALLEERKRWQNQQSVCEYASNLVHEASKILSKRWQSRYNHHANIPMAIVELPSSLGRTKSDAFNLGIKLAQDYAID